MLLSHVFSQFLNHDLNALATTTHPEGELTFVLLKGGLLVREMLLVLRVPFRRGVTERDLGVIDLRGLDGERDRESTEAGLLERVRSRPRETDRDGMLVAEEDRD
jgi:hypothetical protein